MFKWSINMIVDKFTRNENIQTELHFWHFKIAKCGEGKEHVVGV